MASLLERTLGAVRKENTGGQGNRRVSGGGESRASPYARPEGGSWKHDRFGETEEASDSARQGGRSAVSSRGDQGPSPKLVITNLHYEVSERELEVLFVQIGPIAAGPKIKNRRHRNGSTPTGSLTILISLSLSLLASPLYFPFHSSSDESSCVREQKFDRSGRSEGVAWVTFASEKHAAAAKEAFDGALAKGEPIKVDFDYRIDRPEQRGTPAAGSLLARVGGPVDGGNTRGPKFASSAAGGGRGTGPRYSAGRSERGVGSSSGAGPRGGGGRESRDGGRASGGGGGRGGGRGAGGRGGERFKAQPKSGGDLDAELEAFMKAPSGGSSSSAAKAAPQTTTAAAAPAPEATSGGDVEMA
ncbi:hypothetical protein C6P46_006307 [Rhodotorula mucilaginosa]|uniref:RRM domain-containing protein n=1 Tax=Rhodotorula mucilaginosa TaxID=5537 RepID=A0A9P6VYS6_RHOMI|nr:hypothetical protein C6P46_006307 [Rhodotorula mucilaginosa]